MIKSLGGSLLRVALYHSAFFAYTYLLIPTTHLTRIRESLIRLLCHDLLQQIEIYFAR